MFEDSKFKGEEKPSSVKRDENKNVLPSHFRKSETERSRSKVERATSSAQAEEAKRISLKLKNSVKRSTSFDAKKVTSPGESEAAPPKFRRSLKFTRFSSSAGKRASSMDSDRTSDVDRRYGSSAPVADTVDDVDSDEQVRESSSGIRRSRVYEKLLKEQLKQSTSSEKSDGVASRRHQSHERPRDDHRYDNTARVLHDRDIDRVKHNALRHDSNTDVEARPNHNGNLYNTFGGSRETNLDDVMERRARSSPKRDVIYASDDRDRLTRSTLDGNDDVTKSRPTANTRSSYIQDRAGYSSDSGYTGAKSRHDVTSDRTQAQTWERYHSDGESSPERQTSSQRWSSDKKEAEAVSRYSKHNYNSVERSGERQADRDAVKNDNHYDRKPQIRAPLRTMRTAPVPSVKTTPSAHNVSFTRDTTKDVSTYTFLGLQILLRAFQTCCCKCLALFCYVLNRHSIVSELIVFKLPCLQFSFGPWIYIHFHLTLYYMVHFVDFLTN